MQEAVGSVQAAEGAPPQTGKETRLELENNVFFKYMSSEWQQQVA